MTASIGVPGRRGRLVASPAGQPGVVAGARAQVAAVDWRRSLQLALAGIWLLDGVLQLQANFFTSDFGKTTLGGVAAGNPGIIADPITWSAKIIQHNPSWTNAIFAAIQIGLGLAIAYRPTLRVGLAASVLWSLGVWWFGEGLGGVVSGTANTLTGAPGAVILYGLLAVLLWPTDRPRTTSEAGRLVGDGPAAALWVVLWAALAWFSLAGANRAAQAFHDAISAEANGEPKWVGAMDGHLAAWFAHDGLAWAIILAVACLLIASAVIVPRPVSDGLLGLAAVVSVAIWVVGQNFGALLTNGATDVNSGPLLVLTALAYWGCGTRPGRATGVTS